MGWLGALSIIRFRTAVKEPKDTSFLFWSITAGIANGVLFFKLALISTLFIGLFLLTQSKRFFVKPAYVLIVKYGSINERKLYTLLRKHCRKQKLRNRTLTDRENELIFEVIPHSDNLSFVDGIKKISGVTQTSLVSYEGSLVE